MAAQGLLGMFSGMPNTVHEGTHPSAGQPAPDVAVSSAQAEFLQFCAGYGVQTPTQHLLLTNGVDTLLALTMLQPGDLEQMGLPLGQLRLIQGALLSLQDPTSIC